MAPHLILFLPHLCVFACLHLCVPVSSVLVPSVTYAGVCRPESAGGFSSCPSTVSRNGEKDWENDSTTSSTPSNTEYTGILHTFHLTESRNPGIPESHPSTPSNPNLNGFSVGPKLYKEPSAKSNKHIIQNALAHCCLAGKVNEGQKNKILDVCKLLFSEI